MLLLDVCIDSGGEGIGQYVIMRSALILGSFRAPISSVLLPVCLCIMFRNFPLPVTRVAPLCEVSVRDQGRYHRCFLVKIHE